MPEIFKTIDKINPAYDFTYNAVMVICKLLLIADILITSMAVLGRYISFIPDPAWSEEVVLTCMSYMAVLAAALAIRRGAHIRMTALDIYLPKGLVKFLDILADISVFALSLIIIVLRVHVQMYVHVQVNTCKGKRRPSELLEIELQVLVSHCFLGVRGPTRVL